MPFPKGPIGRWVHERRFYVPLLWLCSRGGCLLTVDNPGISTWDLLDHHPPGSVRSISADIRIEEAVDFNKRCHVYILLKANR